MLYFIGGAARCGKSTLATSLLAHKLGAAYVSGDALRQTVKPLLPDFRRSLDIADTEEYITYYEQQTDAAVSEARQRSRKLWPCIERYITSLNYEWTGDIIIESIDIWPEFIYDIKLPYVAAFLVDTSDNQADRVIAHKSAQDWMSGHNLTNHQIQAWAVFNAARSREIMLEAKENYYAQDVGIVGFERAQQSALEYLLLTR